MLLRIYNSQNPFIILFRTGWEHAGSRRPWLIVCLVMFILAQMVALAEPYIIGQLLNSVQVIATSGSTTVARDSIMRNLWCYFLIQVIFWLFHGPSRVLERNLAFHIKANYKHHLFTTVTNLSMQWHRQHHSGESIDKINRATKSLAMFFESTFEVNYMVMRLIGSLIALFCFMPFAGMVAIATSIVSAFCVSLIDRILCAQYEELNDYENRTASALHDYVSNISSVITLRLEGRVRNEVMRRMLASLSLFKLNASMNELKWFMNSMLIATMCVLVLFNYASTELTVHHTLLAGTFFTLFEYLRRIGDSFYNFTGLYGTVVQEAVDVKCAETITASLNAGGEISVDRLPDDWSELNIRNLHFKYEDEKHREHHLENVSINLRRSAKIAFIGESGSGKSTLLSVLRGMQNANGAELFCDGKLQSGGLHHLAQHTTLIPQDPEIFADSILFNITFGMDADDSEILKAIRLAKFDSVLARLEFGLQTNIAEKGVNLSGGEKQRLALARGIFFARDCDILLMDEPTSSVDPANERRIYENVFKEYADKCIISSIHKLHLLEMFDEIYVFGNGKLMESGSFSELLSRDGEFARMWANYQTESRESAAA